MSSKTKKLSALADIYGREHLDGAITKLKLASIRPSEDQPRQDRRHKIQELAESIKQDGLINPLLVTKTKDERKYRIIAGERRYHAVTSLGWAEVECKIVSRGEGDYWRIAIIENLQREDLDAAEEAVALQKLKKLGNLSDAELASQVGKSRNYITEILGINSMPDEVMQRCKDAGINNKNILIQASQSWKKGTIDHFIEAWKGGTIQTVRQAKSYNKGTSTKEAASSNSKTDRAPPPEGYRIASTGSRITVNCPNPDSAKALRDKIQKWVNANS